MISIILTVHNQENLIRPVLDSIREKVSKLTNELIIVLDGCTDGSKEIVLSTLTEGGFPSNRVMYAPDVFETKANNIGLRASTQPFCMIMQDDMILEEDLFDAKLLTPFTKFDDVFAVSARTAHDNTIINNELHHINLSGFEHGLQKRIFSIRDSVNRGPLMLNHSILENVGYLDEAFAPQGLDDHDLCMRVWAKHRMVSGAYVVDYRSDLEWGSTRKPGQIAHIIHHAWMKNAEIIKSRHYDALMGEKHGEERECLYGIQASLI